MAHDFPETAVGALGDGFGESDDPCNNLVVRGMLGAELDEEGAASEGELSLFLYPSSEEEEDDDNEGGRTRERGPQGGSRGKGDWRRHGYEGAAAVVDEWEDDDDDASESDARSVSPSAVSIQTTFLHSILPDLSPTWRMGPAARPLLGDDQSMSLAELFALEDQPENLFLDGEGKIVAATRWKLVERLTTDPGKGARCARVRLMGGCCCQSRCWLC